MLACGLYLLFGVEHDSEVAVKVRQQMNPKSRDGGGDQVFNVAKQFVCDLIVLMNSIRKEASSMNDLLFGASSASGKCLILVVSIACLPNMDWYSMLTLPAW
jgi:hypothetical protein